MNSDSNFHNPWLVAARKLTWISEPWLEPNYVGVMRALEEMARSDFKNRSEAEDLIKKLFQAGKAPPSAVLSRDG